MRGGAAAAGGLTMGVPVTIATAAGTLTIRPAVHAEADAILDILDEAARCSAPAATGRSISLSVWLCG